MARGKTSKFSRTTQDSVLGRIVDKKIANRSNSPNFSGTNALDFIEANTGLGVHLFPAQRVITKLTFGIPIDYKPVKVPIWDPLKTKLLYTFTEEEFLHWLYEEGKCNVQDWRDVPEHGFGTSVLVAGRRGGKSQVVSAIAGTMLRNLLTIPSPQDYYGLVPGSPIDFTFLGTDEDSSTRLYDKLQADINRSGYFTPFLRDNGTTAMTFVSDSDRDNREIKPSITVAAFPCTTRSVRGPSSYFLALDEFAHFRSSKDANSSDIFEAATPSTSFFPNPEDPERADSRILAISSPLNKIGKFYELHKQGMDEGIGSDILTIRLSTVEMNPKIPAAKLREFYNKNPDTFHIEYGANFADGAGSYIPPEKFNICIREDRENLTRFSLNSVGRKYFWGLDYGTKNDATALAIGHLEMMDKGVGLIFDYIDRMMVGEAFTGPGVEDGARIKDLTELDIRDIVSWCYAMHQVLPCFRGVTDQGGGVAIKQLLQINGITTMDLVHLTDQINSKMYYALKGYIDNGTASFPNVPKFKTEFNQLEAELKSKYVLKVQAPEEKGAHDDMADAAALVAWQAQIWMEEEGKLDLDPTGRTLQVDPRIANPISIVNPNDVSLRDLQVMERQRAIGVGLMLPPDIPIVRTPRRYR